MSMAHFMCVTGTGEFCSFEKGYHRIGSIIQTEKYQYLLFMRFVRVISLTTRELINSRELTYKTVTNPLL